MAEINWDDVAAAYPKRQFKDYAGEGNYKVKCIGAEVIDAGKNGNKLVKFYFEDTDQYQFPTADHWISKNNFNWRIKHMKDLLVFLGSTEEKAKKVCEAAESKDFEYAGKAYGKAFELLLAKEPEVELRVVKNGKFSVADFADRSVGRDLDKEIGRSVIAEATPVKEEDIDLSDLPF
jgi:hypothetical protein